MKSELTVPAWSAVVPEGPFVRVRGHALRRLEGDSADQLIEQILQEYRELDWTDLHVWQRDIASPGWNGCGKTTNPKFGFSDSSETRHC